MASFRIALLALAVALVPGPAASAQDTIGDAARSLSLAPVYADPAAERALTAPEAKQLRQRVSSSDAGPVYVAVLPESAKQAGGGSAQGVAQEIARRLGRPGTYAVVAGRSFSAGRPEGGGGGSQGPGGRGRHPRAG